VDARFTRTTDNNLLERNPDMTTYSPTAHESRTLVPVAATSALLGAALLIYGAHDWAEIIVSTSVLFIVTALVYGLVVPGALRKESAGRTGLALSVPAVLLTAPAFWTGLPLVLGVAGMVVGTAGRNARNGAGMCIAALVLGALAVLGYLAIYVADALNGGAGFLFD
jgi:hypothetical protein